MSPRVETRCGALRGRETRGIRSFRGIPYARPPVGPRRFRPPEAPEPWAGERDATRPGWVAPQPTFPVFRSVALAGGGRQDEDCLTLNVWTPGLDQARRPVLVWIHGGGFLIGSGGVRLYDGGVLARRGDLVVVTLNYRLGALGFLHLHGVSESFEGASNPGVRDQIAALEWVRDNIAAFGGDPENVTLFGQSAGAMSIGALIASPRGRGVFHRAILQSGAADHLISRERADEVARAFLQELGGPAPTPESLGRIPLRDILAAQAACLRRLRDDAKLMIFLPSIDGDLIPESPLEAVRRGATVDRPLLIGTTLDEWKLFTVVDPPVSRLDEPGLTQRLADMLPLVARSAPPAGEAARQYREALRARGASTTPFEVWSAFQSGRVFHYPASLLAETQAAAGGPAYSYLFTWRPPGMRKALGAFHALDVPFVFGLTSSPVFRPLAKLTGSAGRLAGCMQGAWIEFARSGCPGVGELPEWRPYEAGQRSTMLLDRSCRLASAPLEDERRLLERWVAAG